LIDNNPGDKLPTVEKPAKLNENTLEQLRRAKQNWNRLYGEFVEAVDFVPLGTITTDKEIEIVKKWIRENHSVPHVESEDQPKIEVEKIEFEKIKFKKIKFEKVTPKTIHECDYADYPLSLSYQEYIANSIEKGVSAVEFRWRTKDLTFSTLTICGIHGIKFDSMLSNVFEVKRKRISRKIRLSDCKQYECLWIWGSVRGRVSACVGFFEDPLECNGSVDGWMTLGKFASQLIPFPPRKKKHCCKSIWAYAFATPMASIQISPSALAGLPADAVEITITGIGSKISGKEILRNCKKI